MFYCAILSRKVVIGPASIYDMTQEEVCGRVYDTLQVCDVANERSDDDKDTSSVYSDRTSGVRDMIMRFERGLAVSGDEEQPDYRQIEDGRKTPTYIVKSIHHQLTPIIYLNTPNNRTSTTSVNSILSGLSEISYGSGSSATGSERRSESEYRPRLNPTRPAPPPPEFFAESDSCVNRSPMPDDENLETRFVFTPPLASPILNRMAFHPPVMRRKSLIESQKDLSMHWSYGVKQGDLEKLLKIRRRLSNVGSKQAPHSGSVGGSEAEEMAGDDEGTDDCVQEEDGCVDAASTDRSTDTLIDEDAYNSDRCDSLTVASDLSERRSAVDNLSIRSISSLDMIPHQTYDSITVSSDEFGSEECHAPDNEFLSVSAVNECCVAKSSKPVVIPIESKKDKYRRLLMERVNELLHTESLYVEKLRHVVEDYIPELERADAPPTVRGLRFEIFANIDKMHRFHADRLLPDLLAAEHDLRKLGQCFRKYEQKFNMYVIYSRNNKRASRLVYEHKQFFQDKQLKLGERLDLASYLLEPVQRIPRYKLFLDDLVKTYKNYETEQGDSDSLGSKVSPESNDTGWRNGETWEGEVNTLQSLELAKTMIETLLVTVDDVIALENIRDCPMNLLNQGKLLRQHEFLVTDPTRRRQPMRLFLFEKLLLLTVVYKKQLTVEVFVYRDHIPADELSLTAKEQDRHKFRVLWYRKRDTKNYKLETTEPGVRAAWVEDITELLWKQAKTEKELVLQSRSSRNSVISVTSQQSSDDGDLEPPSLPPGDKYNSLRGVPGEVKRRGEKQSTHRSTTWYYE